MTSRRTSVAVILRVKGQDPTWRCHPRAPCQSPLCSGQVIWPLVPQMGQEALGCGGAGGEAEVIRRPDQPRGRSSQQGGETPRLWVLCPMGVREAAALLMVPGAQAGPHRCAHLPKHVYLPSFTPQLHFLFCYWPSVKQRS